MVFFVKSVKHTFYTLHTIIPDFGDVRKLTGYSPFTFKIVYREEDHQLYLEYNDIVKMYDAILDFMDRTFRIIP